MFAFTTNTQRTGSSSLDNILSNSQQFEVMYVGKIKVYTKRAPPSFIDDAVESFRTINPAKVKFSNIDDNRSNNQQQSDRSESENSLTPTPLNDGPDASSLSLSSSPTTTASIANELGMQRPRSISSLTTCKEYKETFDEESPREEINISLKNATSSLPSHPVTITCTHSDEKDSVFSDEGRESMDDSFNNSRPESSASTASGIGGIFGTSGTSLHLPSTSLITNTQSLDEQGRASILRDLEVCSKQTQESLSPIQSPNNPDVMFKPDASLPVKNELKVSPTAINEKETSTITRVPSPSSFLLDASLTHPLAPAPDSVSSTSLTPSVNSAVRKLSTEKQVSLPCRTRTSGGASDLRRNRQSSKFQNRTMLFLIGRLAICLISPDLQQILFNKTFNYVSHCSQGVKYMDHFGFICREPSYYPSESYVGYVFRCQTDKLVNEIMHTLKQAFHNAHHACQVNKNKSIIICEACPMQWFHRLCMDVENLSAKKAQTVILERLDSLPDADKNEIMSKYEGSQVSSIDEQNRIIMGLLRRMSERKQQNHNHNGKDEKRNSISTLDNLKQKARKSLSSSLETILKRTGSPSIAQYYSPSKGKSEHTETRARASTISGSISIPEHSNVRNEQITLDYEEITPCLKETSKMWDEILKQDFNDSTLEFQLKEGIKKGVPRSKRGEIWQFIARYNKHTNRIPNACKDVGSVDPDKPYRELLQQLTAQQHAILVDLGRTFPKHPYFAQPLGAGQLSLFNLLKAYSLFDTEVGYCQGLSFVAAILLLHMSEDDSFEMMKYLLFYLGLRRQYKPDMSALQMQLYQLTRLLYDFHHDIYEHFDAHDIPPTLYAAPWFLTLFASQFPIGFVARLFDILFLYGIEAIFRLSTVLLNTYREAILSCQSFETIMELLKNNIPAMNPIQMERVFNQVLTRDISKQLIIYETEYNLLQEDSTVSSLSSTGSITSTELYGSTGNLLSQIPRLSPNKGPSTVPLVIPASLAAPTPSEPIASITVESPLVVTSTSPEVVSTKSCYVDSSTETVNLPDSSESTGLTASRLIELESENKLLKGQNMELLDQLHVAQSNVYSLESSIETLKSTIKRLESRVRSVEEERDALFDSLNMLRQRTISTNQGSSVNPSSSGGTTTPISSPLPEPVNE
ncbi:TBC1 domain family member 4 [Tetranychus urticae]|uniref:Rab-GAP TBC domain-containing protein n=1 Tax=Tetranychus urticae TaxID=32264 RepID=T1JPZ1_TETUR|nr:TBC1 domain family member 4 [Tetranychus urticae]